MGLRYSELGIHMRFVDDQDNNELKQGLSFHKFSNYHIIYKRIFQIHSVLLWSVVLTFQRGILPIEILFGGKKAQ